MKGIVVKRALHKNCIYVVVEHDNTLTTIETNYAEDFEYGDIISGELQTLGGEDFYNHSQQFPFDGIVQNIYDRLKR